MEYKGYTVAVSIALLGSGAQSHPTYTILRGGEVVHEVWCMQNSRPRLLLARLPTVLRVSG